MIKEIKYNGFTEAPSDYECPDGDLAGLEGLVQEEETLHPIAPPAQLFTLPTGYRVVLIHKSTYEHYIIRTANKLYWIEKPTTGATLTPANDYFHDDDGDNKNLLRDFTGETIHDINAVGNTLIVLTSYGMHYFLWKNSAYSYLGTHIPELPLSFGLQGRREISDAFNLDSFSGGVWISLHEDEWEFSEADKDYVTEHVMAHVNKFIADHYTNGNEFMYPFFVRYAYRMYDGSLSMHSAPVLMICSTGQNPLVRASEAVRSQANFTAVNNCKVFGALYKLDFATVDQSYIDELKKWSDIVSSVDIFISAPLYTIDQSGKCQSLSLVDINAPMGDENSYCVCKATHGGDYGARYQYHSISNFMQYGLSTVPRININLPKKGSKTEKENIISTSNFYFLNSYKLTELSTTRRIIPIENGYLQSLVNRERMTDDYDSHSELIAKYSFAYNSRLNIAGIKRVLPNGFHMGSLLNYTNGFVQVSSSDPTQVDNTNRDTLQYVKMHIYIKEQGKDFIVESYEADGGGIFDLPGWACGLWTPTPFLYYPNKNAYKAVLKWTRYLDPTDPFSLMSEVYREIHLEPHPMLNGAFFFDWAKTSGTKISPYSAQPSSKSARSIELPNKIYSSEVNNPFNFPASGISTVGTGTILNISSAVKALSQGQFGQFPLYAFTDEGVWALEVSSTGTISARQPVTRDVCINPESITQIDTAVLFATKRGIMLISGSNSSCISDTINSENPFDINELQGLTGKGSRHVRFIEYIEGCSMLYDYTHQRIIIYNPTKVTQNGVTTRLYDYAYVFSLKSKMWSTMPCNITSSLNSYPDAFAEIDRVVPPELEDQQPTIANTVVNFSDEQPNVTTGLQGLLVTRPLKLDAPDILKTIDTVIQRGYFRKGHVKTILYGSRDLFHWHPVSSSVDHYLRGFRGTPYKYFRIALLCNLDKDESIFGCTVQYTPRLNNQPR